MNIKSKKTIDQENLVMLARSTSAKVESARLVVFDKNCDMTAFNKACEGFRNLCFQIGSLLGIENFTGGYDEIEDLKKSIVSKIDQYDTAILVKILIVFVELISADLNCNNEADKIGLYGSSWWYKCWENDNQ